MDDKLMEKVEEKIKEIEEVGINENNLEYLYKLTKIKHMMKEDESMNYGYGNYGNYNGYGNYGRPGYDSYGNYGNSYGRRGYDSKYRGYEQLDRMGENYGRYSEGHSRYGANEDSKRSLQTMLGCMEEFVRVIKEDVKSPEEEQMIRESMNRISQM